MDPDLRFRWATQLEDPGISQCQPGWYGPWRPGEHAAAVRMLLRRDGKRCWYCGEPFGPSGPTIEHVIARSKGGPNRAPWNLRLVHKRCNERLGSMSWHKKHKAAKLHNGPPPEIPPYCPEAKKRKRGVLEQTLATLGDVWPAEPRTRWTCGSAAQTEDARARKPRPDHPGFVPSGLVRCVRASGTQ